MAADWFLIKSCAEGWKNHKNTQDCHTEEKESFDIDVRKIYMACPRDQSDQNRDNVNT